MTFSLIMATLGRESEVALFCRQLTQQSFKDFELIIVDQNEDERLTPIVTEYRQSFCISHIRSSQRGLSYNRNIGLIHAQGDIIAFPDDDCWYEPELLSYVFSLFEQNVYEYICLNICDPANRLYMQKSVLRHPIKKRSFYAFGISAAIFVKKRAIKDFQFDTLLGLGASYGSGEDTDLLLFCLTHRYRCVYDGARCVYHPYKPEDKTDMKRAYSYARGFGAIHRKAIISYRMYWVYFKFMFALSKNLFGIMISKNKIYYITAFKGKLEGFLSYRPAS